MHLIKRLIINAGIALLVSGMSAFMLWIVFAAAVMTMAWTNNLFLTMWVSLGIISLMISAVLTILTYSKPIEVKK